jgi:hypothetical protein
MVDDLIFVNSFTQSRLHKLQIGAVAPATCGAWLRISDAIKGSDHDQIQIPPYLRSTPAARMALD